MVILGAEGVDEDEAKLQILTRYSSDQKKGGIVIYSFTAKVIEEDE